MTLKNTSESDANGVLMTDVLPSRVDIRGLAATERRDRDQRRSRLDGDDQQTPDGRLVLVGVLQRRQRRYGEHGLVPPSTGSAAATRPRSNPIISPLLYLPLIYKGFIDLPDLVVTDLSATSGEVRVTIRNVGTELGDRRFLGGCFVRPAGPAAADQPAVAEDRL